MLGLAFNLAAPVKTQRRTRCPIQVVTINPNCWASAKASVEHIWESNAQMKMPSPAVFLFQELRLAEDNLILAENWARNRGYKFVGAPAKKTSADPRALSAGTGLMVYQAFGVKPGRRSKAFPDRICFADVALAGAVAVRFISGYLFCSEGPSKRNLDILAEILVTILDCKFPWCLACDFNLTPSVLEETGFLKHSGGVLARSGFATCFQGNTEYDYFVVSPCLAAFASQAKVLDGPSWPHAPVTLSFSNLRSAQVLFRHKRFFETYSWNSWAKTGHQGCGLFLGNWCG